MLCNMQPRVETLLQSVPINWQNLDETDTVQLQSLIQEYADVFAMDHKELGRTDLVQHVIDIADQAPIKQPPVEYHFHCIQR